MSTLHAVMTRSDVRGLLMRHTTARIEEDVITVWLDGLAGYSLTECHRALAALGPAARRATPSEVAGYCEAARGRAAEPTSAADEAAGVPDQRPAPAPAQPAEDVQRTYHRAAGDRGRRAVYAAMNWALDADHELARTVACPFCPAKAGEVCTPLSRNRAGVEVQRARGHRMHPPRLLRAQFLRDNTDSQTGRETTR